MTSHYVRMLGWSFVLVLVTVATTMAHLATTRTMPEADATVEESPDRVRVWFTQDPDPAVSMLTLEGPGGDVALGETMVVGEKSLVATVTTTLAPGRYTVSWRSAGDDGHVRRGDFAFTVRTTN